MKRKRSSASGTAAQAGDDYELCFTAPPSAAALINEVAAQVSVPLTYIGHIVDAIDGESGVTVDGVAVKRGGYLHF